MIVTQRGAVDITPEYNRALRPVFCVSEGDKTSRRIVITVMQSGEKFLIPSGSTVYIVGKKPDNNVFTYRCTYSGSEVTFSVTDQMSAVSGIVLCELQINLNGEVLGSANFVYWTEPTPLENGTYSESDLNIFLEAIAGAERLDNFYAGVEGMVAEAVEQIQVKPGQTVIDPTLLVNGAAADAAATGNAVRSFLEALVTETTPTAAIATCDDAAGGLPLKKLTAQIEPTQSGTGDPSPDNVRPISGYTGVTVTRTGKNLLDDSKRIANSSLTAITLGQTAGYGTPTIFVKAGTYTFSAVFKDGASGAGYVKVGSASPVRIWATGQTHGTITIESDSMCSFYVYNADGFPSQNCVNGQVELGTTPTEYEPGNIETYTVTFPTAAGTVYGGTLTVNSDGSGTLTVTQNAMVTFDGSENWTAQGSGATATYRVARGALPANAKGMVCNMLIMDDAQTAVVGHGYVGTTNLVCYIADASADNLAAWKASLAETPMQIVYTVTTPTTYALSAVQVVQMLQGVNNVWTDAAGTVIGEYYANTALYVEKIVNAQKGMIAGVEENMIATQNYSVGDLLIVGNTLYKVTAAVSSGAALVVGTNVAETTVAEQLLALA